MDEELDVEERDGHQSEGGVEDDVDIYEDLETTGKESDANCNIIEKFHKLCNTKNQQLDDDFYVDDAEGEEDVDLYDLNTFENHIAAEELEVKVESLEKRCSQLDKENAELKTELQKVNKMNTMLKRNISSIFKTAKTELERKERQLKDLQREHDALIFRRAGSNAKAQQSQPLSANTSQVPAILPPGCQILKKDSEKGNLFKIENETECTFQMGLVSVSFVTESSDFEAKRFDRFKVAAAREKETVKVDLKNTKESEKIQTPQQEKRSQNLASSKTLEDGEVPEEDEAKSGTSREAEGPMARNMEDSRRRSRSSSRSPISKRKRSSSPNMEKHYLRSQRPNERGRQNERGPPQRTRKPRTPTKPYSHRNGASHFNSRSNRR